ncbi:MAG: hypothetical protein AB7R69_04020 [Candidatus Babeliales bacterium]
MKKAVNVSLFLLVAVGLPMQLLGDFKPISWDSGYESTKPGEFHARNWDEDKKSTTPLDENSQEIDSSSWQAKIFDGIFYTILAGFVALTAYSIYTSDPAMKNSEYAGKAQDTGMFNPRPWGSGYELNSLIHKRRI